MALPLSASVAGHSQNVHSAEIGHVFHLSKELLFVQNLIVHLMYHSSIKCPLMFKSYQVKCKQYPLQNYFIIFSYAKKKK